MRGMEVCITSTPLTRSGRTRGAKSDNQIEARSKGVGTLYQGYPLQLQQDRTRVVIHNYALRGGAAGPRGRLLPHWANGPGPVSALGTGPVTPRVPEEGKLRANSRGRGHPIGVQDLPASVRTSYARRTNIPPGRGPGAPRVPQAQARARARARVFRWKTRPPTAFNSGG